MEGTESEGLGEGEDVERGTGLGLSFGDSVALSSSVCCTDSSGPGAESGGDCNYCRIVRKSYNCQKRL